MKIRNAFANNTSRDTKPSKTQISEITQLGGSFGSWLGNLVMKTRTDLAIPLARGDLSGLVSNLPSNRIKKFERTISGKEALGEGKRIYFICFE